MKKLKIGSLLLLLPLVLCCLLPTVKGAALDGRDYWEEGSWILYDYRYKLDLLGTEDDFDRLGTRRVMLLDVDGTSMNFEMTINFPGTEYDETETQIIDALTRKDQNGIVRHGQWLLTSAWQVGGVATIELDDRPVEFDVTSLDNFTLELDGLTTNVRAYTLKNDDLTQPSNGYLFEGSLQYVRSAYSGTILSMVWYIERIDWQGSNVGNGLIKLEATKASNVILQEPVEESETAESSEEGVTKNGDTGISGFGVLFGIAALVTITILRQRRKS